MNAILFKRLLLLFWALWFSIVFLSNLADGLKALGLLPDAWAFASDNFKFIKETTARYGTPAFVNGVLFAWVIVWEGFVAVLFWRAGWAFQGKKSANKALYSAFTASLLLWAGF